TPRPFTLTGESGLLGVGLSGGDGGLAARLRFEDRRVLEGLGLLLHAVTFGVGGLTYLGVELTFLQLGVAFGDLLLLGEDRLVPFGLGQRPGRLGTGVRRVDLGLDRRL